MLFLGTADDKTAQYPYGSADSKVFDQRRILLHHILFGDESLLLEEGFVLASQEAMRPGTVQPFLLSAIRSGLIKVASRYQDLHVYTRERRGFNHDAPPDNTQGREYLTKIQEACVGANAFVEYPSETIDELTFSRFMAFRKSGAIANLLDSAECQLPKDFYTGYQEKYETGNNGHRWTARSAWEAILKAKLAGHPGVIHALMCRANRERQILRAAATGKRNGMVMTVETGFEVEPHDLAKAIGGGTIDRRKIGSIGLYPRVCTADAIRQCDKLFRELADPTSTLTKHREIYLLRLRDKVFDEKGIAAAARDYERHIYDVIDRTPCEDSQLVEILAGIGVERVLGAAESALSRYRRKSNEPVRLADVLIGKKPGGGESAWDRVNAKGAPVLPSRRSVLKGVTSLAIVGVVALDNPVNRVVMNTVRDVRTGVEGDIGDLGVAHSSGISLSHQILRIDADAATSLI